jgi:hypothetical protein
MVDIKAELHRTAGHSHKLVRVQEGSSPELQRQWLQRQWHNL